MILTDINWNSIGRFNAPEEGYLDEILGPPHGGGLDEVAAEEAGPAESEDLRGEDDAEGDPEGHLAAVE